MGYAWRDPSWEVFAFDIDPVSRTQARQLAKMNGVSERVRIGDRCSHDTLNRLLAERSLLIMDVEGYEAVLLDPQKVPGLAATDILVELHDVACQDQPRVEEVVRARFAGTHQITSYSTADPSDWVEICRCLWECKLSREELVQSVEESPSEPQVWLWMAAQQAIGKPSTIQVAGNSDLTSLEHRPMSEDTTPEVKRLTVPSFASIPNLAADAAFNEMVPP